MKNHTAFVLTLSLTLTTPSAHALGTTGYAANDANVAATAAFTKQVERFSADARPINNTWKAFVTSCQVKSASASDGRPWFGLWDGRVRADCSNRRCREQSWP